MKAQQRRKVIGEEHQDPRNTDGTSASGSSDMKPPSAKHYTDAEGIKGL